MYFSTTLTLTQMNERKRKIKNRRRLRRMLQLQKIGRFKPKENFYLLIYKTLTKMKKKKEFSFYLTNFLFIILQRYTSYNSCS